VITASDGTMKLYYERQPRGGRKGARWWLFSIRESEESQQRLPEGVTDYPTSAIMRFICGFAAGAGLMEVASVLFPP
jgi:hypothetical protein